MVSSYDTAEMEKALRSLGYSGIGAVCAIIGSLISLIWFPHERVSLPPSGGFGWEYAASSYPVLLRGLVFALAAFGMTSLCAMEQFEGPEAMARAGLSVPLAGLGVAAIAGLAQLFGNLISPILGSLIWHIGTLIGFGLLVVEIGQVQRSRQSVMMSGLYYGLGIACFAVIIFFLLGTEPVSVGIRNAVKGATFDEWLLLGPGFMLDALIMAIASGMILTRSTIFS